MRSLGACQYYKSVLDRALREGFASSIKDNPAAAGCQLMGSSIGFGERWLNGVTGFLRREHMFAALGEVVHVLEHGQIHQRFFHPIHHGSAETVIGVGMRLLTSSSSSSQVE